MFMLACSMYMHCFGDEDGARVPASLAAHLSNFVLLCWLCAPLENKDRIAAGCDLTNVAGISIKIC